MKINSNKIFTYLYKKKNYLINSFKVALMNRLYAVKIDYDYTNHIGIIEFDFYIYNQNFEVAEELGIQINFHFKSDLIIAHKKLKEGKKIILNDLNINIEEIIVLKNYLNNVIANELINKNLVFKKSA